jgi:hypothetical protein
MYTVDVLSWKRSGLKILGFFRHRISSHSPIAAIYKSELKFAPEFLSSTITAATSFWKLLHGRFRHRRRAGAPRVAPCAIEIDVLMLPH